ncbi:amylo-alpha-1,6-glucosidase [Acaryochloris sp. IP29b_bin.137]|uniref:amylo-alpha-1,6-glucosidase n=1 Tax=Acaryochloris sp. IP29b_bin.137 TaxID=2969217 RepID=UPI002633AFBC|nr:amylo-alpha-1,6-glucosidase [Acaryochloris sp. IP29b_bin.137]
MIQLGREITSDLKTAAAREWLVTNGIGGYAAGTVAGLLTRRYHGLLIAALTPPLERTLLLTQLEETVLYNGDVFDLATTQWADGSVKPQGYRFIEQFKLEGSVPCWHYACADALLEKRVWMQQGENTTYVYYQLSRGSSPVALSIKALINYRDHHSQTHTSQWQMQTQSVAQGTQILATDTATPFYLRVSQGGLVTQHHWYQGFALDLEHYRGLDDQDNHLHISTLEVVLTPGDSLTVVASTQPHASLDGATALLERRFYEETIRGELQTMLISPPLPSWIEQLAFAADQFIVDRPLAEAPEGKTVIAGYPWFGDWGRDTMISLPGLTLSTGRPRIAKTIMRTFARYLDQGMLPNVFPEVGKLPEYNTVDAILWYFEAIRLYIATTEDMDMLQELFPTLVQVIDWHRQGTRYHIHVEEDGLLYAGEAGAQLTWMDAKIGDWVVTPRTGKPIEVNALWYNALRTMERFAQQLGQPQQIYREMAQLMLEGFQRFWQPTRGYCADVLDGPKGDDLTLRPNQIFAVSLPLVAGATDAPALLTTEQQKAVVETCSRYLLTSHGLRSLSPDEPQYKGTYGGDQVKRDSRYHQGTVWGWLLGPYVQAHYCVYKDSEAALALLNPIANHLQTHGLGSISEIFDGDPPFYPRGCFAQAWSVAEVLRAWMDISQHQTGP